MTPTQSTAPSEQPKQRHRKLRWLEYGLLSLIGLSLIALGVSLLFLRETEYRLYVGTDLSGPPRPEDSYTRQQPSDCRAGELFDEDLELCYYSCVSQEECNAIEEQIKTRAEALAAQLATKEADFAEIIPTEGTTLAEYNVQGQSIILDRQDSVPPELGELQADTAKHSELWQRFNELAPSAISNYVSEFHIFTDGAQATLASVEPVRADLSTWRLIIDVGDAYTSSGVLRDTDLTRSLVHEVGHIVSLNNLQVEYSPQLLMAGSQAQYEQAFTEQAEICNPRYFAEEGCARTNSYLNNFVDKFWTSERIAQNRAIHSDNDIESFYNQYKSEFNTPYSATNPEEDFAESWTAFVLESEPNDPSISSQKVRFMSNFDELNDLRAFIRSRL